MYESVFFFFRKSDVPGETEPISETPVGFVRFSTVPELPFDAFFECSEGTQRVHGISLPVVRVCSRTKTESGNISRTLPVIGERPRASRVKIGRSPVTVVPGPAGSLTARNYIASTTTTAERQRPFLIVSPEITRIGRGKYKYRPNRRDRFTRCTRRDRDHTAAVRVQALILPTESRPRAFSRTMEAYFAGKKFIVTGANAGKSPARFFFKKKKKQGGFGFSLVSPPLLPVQLPRSPRTDRPVSLEMSGNVSSHGINELLTNRFGRAQPVKAFQIRLYPIAVLRNRTTLTRHKLSFLNEHVMYAC